MAITSTPPRRVFITGGTGSVGQSLVEGFSRQGYAVTFQYCNNSEVAKKMEKDFTAVSSQMDFRYGFDSEFLQFDVLINNAGINISNRSSEDISPAVWDETIAVNLTAPYRLIKGVLPGMVNNHWGRIINISSIFGIRGVDRNLPYTVSKHGLSGLTKTIAKEYARMGITCNEICPGPIDSEMIRRIAADKFREEGVNPQEYLSELENEIPAGRLSKVEDVTSLCVFLASKDAQYINGVSIPVDGGLTC